MDDIDWDEGLTLYVPSRTCLVLKKLSDKETRALDLNVEDTDVPTAEEEQAAVDQMVRAEQMAREALKEKKKGWVNAPSLKKNSEVSTRLRRNFAIFVFVQPVRVTNGDA